MLSRRCLPFSLRFCMRIVEQGEFGCEAMGEAGMWSLPVWLRMSVRWLRSLGILGGTVDGTFCWNS